MATPVGDSYGVASGGVIAAGRYRMSPFWRDLPSGWTEITISGTKPPTGMLAYSGMALNSSGGKLYLQGGGHNDYYGEDVWELDLEQRTVWTQHQTPIVSYEIPLENARALTDNTNYPGALVIGGNPVRPISRHTYKTVHWIGSINRIAVGGSSAYSGGNGEYLWYVQETGAGAWWGGGYDYWTYEPNSKSWSYLGSKRLNSTYDTGGQQHLYDPVSDRVFSLTNDGNNSVRMAVWNPHTNIWSNRANVSAQSFTEVLGCYDSKRNRIIILLRNAYAGSDPKLVEYNPSDDTYRELICSGAFPAGFFSGSGMTYSPLSDSVLMLKNGESTLYKLSLATLEWSSQPHPVPNMLQVEGRWVFDQRRGVALLVYSDPVSSVRVFSYRG